MLLAASWNSLEITKVIVAALTPIAVVGAGFWLNKRLKSLEQAHWSQQKVIERRIKAYDEIAPLLNELFCFYCYVGSWKELDPPAVIALKRKVDRVAYTNGPLFDKGFLPTYRVLMDVCFATFGNWGDDAKLKTLTDRRRNIRGRPWNPAWDFCFVGRDDAPEPKVVEDAYVGLTEYLAKAIGATEVNAHLNTQLPGNFNMRAAGRVSRDLPADDGRADS